MRAMVKDRLLGTVVLPTLYCQKEGVVKGKRAYEVQGLFSTRLRRVWLSSPTLECIAPCRRDIA